MTIESDDPQTVLFMRFFREAAAFADSYHYRTKAAQAGHTRALERAPKLAALRDRRARIREMYQELPGSRRDRLKAIRILLGQKGDILSADQLAAELHLANLEHREQMASRVAELAAAGQSLRAIGAALKISFSHARQLLRKALERAGKGTKAPPAPVSLSSMRLLN